MGWTGRITHLLEVGFLLGLLLLFLMMMMMMMMSDLVFCFVWQLGLAQFFLWEHSGRKLFFLLFYCLIHFALLTLFVFLLFYSLLCLGIFLFFRPCLLFDY